MIQTLVLKEIQNTLQLKDKVDHLESRITPAGVAEYVCFVDKTTQRDTKSMRRIEQMMM